MNRLDNLNYIRCLSALALALLVAQAAAAEPKNPTTAQSLTDYGAKKKRDVQQETLRRAEMKIIAQPTDDQLAFHDLELGLFIHFGLETYTGKSAGNGKDSPSLFNPKHLDCDQWMAVAKAMGARYVVLTARHEGGFCNWPSQTTDYGVQSSPWREGKGDVVRAFVEAARRHGLEVGLYQASWHDAHHMNWNDLEYFKQKGPEALEAFTQLQVRQVTELLTHYGPIAYLWFDHHGCASYGTDQFWRRIDAAVRQAQPRCLIFGADVWISGGHGGRAEYPLWNAMNTEDGTRMTRPLGQAGEPWGEFYRVWECNTCASGGWFWKGGGVESLASLVGKYDDSVGRGANLLVNFAPNPDGLMPPEVVQRAREFGEAIRARFSEPLAKTNGTGNEIVLTLAKPQRIDQVAIMEGLRHGQRIANYRIEAATRGEWQTVASGQTVGHKRIHRISPVEADKVRFVCASALLQPVEIRSLAVFNITKSP